jgi:predicted DNA-binding transcriptional regulator AlpA
MDWHDGKCRHPRCIPEKAALSVAGSNGWRGRKDKRKDRMTDHLIDRREVARRLGCSESTVKRLGIPIVKLGRLVRYEPADVEAFKCTRKQGVKPADEQPLPSFPAAKAARLSTSPEGRSRSGRPTVALAQDELKEALVLTARLKQSGKRNARGGTRTMRSASATPAS